MQTGHHCNFSFFIIQNYTPSSAFADVSLVRCPFLLLFECQNSVIYFVFFANPGIAVTSKSIQVFYKYVFCYFPKQ